MISTITSAPQSPFLSITNDPTTTSPSPSGTAADSFTSALGQAFDQVNQLQNNASSQAQTFAMGRSNDIHSAVIAAQKATVALELATQIRNKVLDAYQEVMKTSM